MLRNIKNKGFTLVEIMIVVAIIAILTVIAIPNFISYRDKAYCTAAETDARTVAAAIAEYFGTPSRTAMPTVADLNVPNLANGSTYLLESTNPEILIIIKIETPGRCPKSYQEAAMRADAESVGWDGDGSYYTVIKN